MKLNGSWGDDLCFTSAKRKKNSAVIQKYFNVKVADSSEDGNRH